MPKSTKRFTLHTSALNAQGFRMLTEGVDLSAFEKNPVLLFNHIRPDGNLRNQILPLGYWADLKVEGDSITAVPVFDDKDAFAMQIYNKVEAGILRMCSVGAEPLELSNDAALVVEGQERETVTKWLLKEVSICDIGANPDALVVALYDSKASLIALTAGNMDSVLPKLNKMSKPTKTAAQVVAKKTPATATKKVVKLADPAPAADPNEELEDDDPEEELSDDDKDAVIADLTQKLKDAMEQLTKLQEQAELAEAESQEKEVENLVNKAVASRRITLAQKGHYVRLAKSDFDGTVALLESLPASKSIQTMLSPEQKVKDARLAELSAKSYDELFRTGDLEFVKLHDKKAYAQIFKTKFNKEPKNL